MGSPILVRNKIVQPCYKQHKIKYLSIEKKKKIVNILAPSSAEAVSVISGFKDFKKILGIK